MVANVLLELEEASVNELNAQTVNAQVVSQTMQGQAICEGNFVTNVNNQLNTLAATAEANPKNQGDQQAYTNFSTVSQNQEQQFGNNISTLQGTAQASSQNTQQATQFASDVTGTQQYVGSELQQSL